eukprot:gene6187-348_t
MEDSSTAPITQTESDTLSSSESITLTETTVTMTGPSSSLSATRSKNVLVFVSPEKAMTLLGSSADAPEFNSTADASEIYPENSAV